MNLMIIITIILLELTFVIVPMNLNVGLYPLFIYTKQVS